SSDVCSSDLLLGALGKVWIQLHNDLAMWFIPCFFPDRFCVGRREIFQERFGACGVARVRRNEPYNGNGRTNLARQNPYDIVFILLGKHVAEHQHANIDVSIFEPLGSFDDVIRGVRGDSSTSWAKLDLALGGDLVGDAEFVKRLPRSLTGGREIGIFISDAL